MSNEDAVLKEMMKHLQEAARRIQASRHLMQEHALVEDPEYIDVTEAAHRETRRLRDAFKQRTSP